MKKLDLLNQTFGKLTVVEAAEPHVQPSGKKITTWWCVCECGNKVRVRTDNLRNGHTTSCGCKVGRVDITGNVYGRLGVLEYAGNGKWTCICECGNVIDVLTYNLKNGNTQSCGCLQKERASEASFISLVGQTFGKLTVLERVENNRFGHVCYKCACECGGTTIVDAANLRNGVTQSCGCIKSKGEMYINQWLTENNISFQAQYSFDNCFLSSGRRPFYDFAIFNKDGSVERVIEFNGAQHYKITGGWNNEQNFHDTVRRDQEKAEWCKNNNIPMTIIRFDEIKQINEILTELFKTPDMEEAQEVTE